jgi:hypothetical protein
MHLILGEAHGNLGEAERFYADGSRNRQTLSRHFKHQL